MKTISTIIFGLLATCMVIPSYAAPVKASDDDNDCIRLHVQIANTTSKTCQLVSSKVEHGNLVTSPPTTIPVGFTAQFDIKQSFYGPDITLQYNCDSEVITFRSQQNACVVKAGSITAQVQNATSNIKGSYTKEEGSYFWSKPGFLNWLLS